MTKYNELMRRTPGVNASDDTVKPLTHEAEELSKAEAEVESARKEAKVVKLKAESQVQESLQMELAKNLILSKEVGSQSRSC